MGLDYYYQRSIPLLVSVNKFFTLRKSSFYMNYDAGINFPWARGDIYYFQDPGEFSPSLYWAGGIGYKLGLKNRQEGILLIWGTVLNTCIKKRRMCILVSIHLVLPTKKDMITG